MSAKNLCGQQAVVGHGVEHARLAQQHHQHHAGQAGQRADGDDVGRAGQAAIEEGAGDRRFDIDVLPGHHAGENGGDRDIKHGADHQRNDDADGQIALRILGFLRGGGDGVESDIGEEDVGRSRADAGEAEGREAASSP